MDYSSNMPSNKTNDINELQHYLHHALNGLDMALQLHLMNPFQKWSLKTYLFKQKIFHKIPNDYDKVKQKGFHKDDCQLSKLGEPQRQHY
jgi:hypothetical protein